MMLSSAILKILETLTWPKKIVSSNESLTREEGIKMILSRF